MVTWYGDSEDDVDDHQDPLYDWQRGGGEEERGEEGGHPHGEVVERTEVLVLLQSESVEVREGREESAGPTPSQEQALLLVVEVEGLESLLQVEAGRGEDDDAEDGVVVEPVPGGVASVGYPTVESVGHVAGHGHQQPEVGRVGELQPDLGEDEGGGRGEGDDGPRQLEDVHWRSAAGEDSVDDVDGGRDGVENADKDGHRNSGQSLAGRHYGGGVEQEAGQEGDEGGPVHVDQFEVVLVSVRQHLEYHKARQGLPAKIVIKLLIWTKIDSTYQPWNMVGYLKPNTDKTYLLM